MNAPLGYVAIGIVVGSVIMGAVAGAYLSKRTQEAFDAGRRAQRDGIAPWKPIDGLPGWERSERGSVDAGLAAGIVAGLVLLAPALRWWTLVAVVALVVAVGAAAMSDREAS